MQVQHLGSRPTSVGYDFFLTGKWHNKPEALDVSYDFVGPRVIGGMLGAIDVTDDTFERPGMTTSGIHLIPLAAHTG